VKAEIEVLVELAQTAGAMQTHEEACEYITDRATKLVTAFAGYLDGEAFDGLGADGESEYEVAGYSTAAPFALHGSGRTLVFRITADALRVSGKFAAREEVEEALADAARDTFSELVGEKLLTSEQVPVGWHVESVEVE
jgi:hypothetical protein